MKENEKPHHEETPQKILWGRTAETNMKLDHKNNETMVDKKGGIPLETRMKRITTRAAIRLRMRFSWRHLRSFCYGYDLKTSRKAIRSKQTKRAHISSSLKAFMYSSYCKQNFLKMNLSETNDFIK